MRLVELLLNNNIEQDQRKKRHKTSNICNVFASYLMNDGPCMKSDFGGGGGCAMVPCLAADSP